MEITLTLSLDEINHLINLFNDANAIIVLKEREFHNAPSGKIVRINEWLDIYEKLQNSILESEDTITTFKNIKTDLENEN
jgi:hypothetical protein